MKSILCRLGLHSWKPVFRRMFGHAKPPTMRYAIQPIPWAHWHFHQIASKCRRCGKRVVLP